MNANCNTCRNLVELLNWENNDALECHCGISEKEIARPFTHSCRRYNGTIETDDVEPVLFKWIFEIKEKVLAFDIDGISVDDRFEVIGRMWDPDDTQLFTIRRLSDGEVWDGVSAIDLIEMDVPLLSFEGAAQPFTEEILQKVIESIKIESYDIDCEHSPDCGGDFLGGAVIGNVMIDFTLRLNQEEKEYALDYDLYIKGFDTGYAYLADGTPYDHFYGGVILSKENIYYTKDLKEFKKELVKELLSYCRYCGDFLPASEAYKTEVIKKELLALL